MVSADVGIGVRVRSRETKEKAPAIAPHGDRHPGETLHASVVAVDGRGLLILGASGAGKSGLALRLMALGASLVADDRVTLRLVGEALYAAAPATLRGMIEARGIGLIAAEAVDHAPVALAVDLDRAPAARMPQGDAITLLGRRIELILGRGVPNIDVALMFLMKNGRMPDA